MESAWNGWVSRAKENALRGVEFICTDPGNRRKKLLENRIFLACVPNKIGICLTVSSWFFSNPVGSFPGSFADCSSSLDWLILTGPGLSCVGPLFFSISLGSFLTSFSFKSLPKNWWLPELSPAFWSAVLNCLLNSSRSHSTWLHRTPNLPPRLPAPPVPLSSFILLVAEPKTLESLLISHLLSHIQLVRKWLVKYTSKVHLKSSHLLPPPLVVYWSKLSLFLALMTVRSFHQSSYFYPNPDSLHSM